MKNGVYLLLGSNLGNREENLLQAQHSVQKIGSIEVASSIYLTKAWGLIEQPDFLNQVIEICYKESPEKLLHQIQFIENEMGRVREVMWGPRLIDIDILFFNQTILNEPTLQLPHPGIPFRRFTLLPLCEIAESFVHPVLNKTCKQLLAECADQSDVKLFAV